MLVGAIVITGNGTGTNIHITAELGITNITKMIDLATWSNINLFGFYKVAYFSILGQPCSGSQPGKRTHLTTSGNVGIFNYTISVNDHTIANSGINNLYIRTNLNTIAQRHFALKHSVHINKDILSMTNLTSNINARRICQRSTAYHQGIGQS